MDDTEGEGSSRGARRRTSGGGGGSRLAGCFRWFVRFGFVGSVIAAAAAVVLLIVVVGGYRYYVVANPGPQIDRDHIRTIIAQESPVYYRDGTTRVGVFFESEHRLFVPFGEMPRAYVMGIVAAEDGSFWTHWGVNPKGILRAFKDNLFAGGLVSGGSTLTQQTAKNLYYRPDRSAKSKLFELLNALRLEAHYDKSEILEFYANQFHVTGNGRGLGIAARHFFDKEPDELTVAECAFIAGLVKGPTNYDPFLGDEARRAKAITRAHDRTKYVLRRMLDEPAEHLAGPMPDGTPGSREAYAARLTEAEQVRAEAKKLLDDGFELPFRRGTFRYESSAILDEVARRLGEPPFDDLLGQVGIDDPRNAGLVVVTTLDPDAQREATYALWHHLTEVGAWMEGFGAAKFVLDDGKAPRFDPDFPPHVHEFRVARVVEHTGDAGKKELKLDLGGHECRLDRDGVVRVAVASIRGQKGDSGVKAPSADVDAWIAQVPDEAVVLVSVRDVPKNGVARCDLEVRPELQGAVTVLQAGEIRAMVGGNDNRNFNRATALRQFGSTWKPLVYHAALQLGWSPADLVDNTRNVFPFSTTFYYPKPDHEPSDRVSIAWAGVNSENVASIWLLYHLIDRLDGDQLRTLAAAADLTQRPDELSDAYAKRIQELGILSTPARVDEGLFLQSRQEVLAGLVDDPHPEDAVALQSLLFGWGFSAERTRAEREGASTRAWKLRALDNDWRTLNDRLSQCRFQYQALARAFDDQVAPDRQVTSSLSVLLDGDAIRVACGAIPDGYVSADAEFVASVPWSRAIEPAPEPVPEAAPEPRKRRFLFGGGNDAPEPAPREPRPVVGPSGPQLVEAADMLVEDRLHVSTLDAVASAFERRKMAWDLQPDRPDLYDPEVLLWHQDFRTLLAMRYVASLAEDYGVQTEIRQVLSMPLGASEITLEEVTSLYSGLVTGTAFEFTGTTAGGRTAPLPTSTSLIAEIRNVDGRVLYRAEPQTTVVATPQVAELTADILRNVVLHGTGRRAATAIAAGEHPVPVGGKTGTTNDFRNAAFVGFVPVATPTGYAIPGGFTIGAYVGYDDNRSLANKRIKLAGASGALPAWIGTAQGLVAAKLTGEFPAIEAETDGWPLLVDRSLTRVPVDEHTGVSMVDGPATVLVRGGPDAGEPTVQLPVVRRPPRIAPGTIEAVPEDQRPSTPVATEPASDLDPAAPTGLPDGLEPDPLEALEHPTGVDPLPDSVEGDPTGDVEDPDGVGEPPPEPTTIPE
ncbi:MAG: transglycosylase domain-containing protein, partial [Myxococcota bacterium]